MSFDKEGNVKIAFPTLIASIISLITFVGTIAFAAGAFATKDYVDIRIDNVRKDNREDMKEIRTMFSKIQEELNRKQDKKGESK